MMLNRKYDQKVSSVSKDDHDRIPEKKLKSFNYTPVSFEYSDEFKKVIENKEDWADKKLEGVPVNELSDDICDPELDALCRLESTMAYNQYALHVRVVKDIIDGCKSELVRAGLIKEKLLDDNETYKAKLDRLVELQQSLEQV